MGKKYLDIVVGGPDQSGTSTQIEDTIKFFQNKGLVVKDLRGGEAEALFHTEKIAKKVSNILNLEQFKVEYARLSETRNEILKQTNEIHQEGNIASMVQNEVSEYLDPKSADVWIMEEPSNRKAGAAIRQAILYASKFENSFNKLEEAETYSLDRKIEYMLFRGPIRNAGKIIIRSRSEESGAYQIYDKEHNPKGPTIDEFINMPGNKNAFINGPTHIFKVSGDENWTYDDSKNLYLKRKGNRISDDKEKDIGYQFLVSQRYTTDWLEKLYQTASEQLGSEVPEFYLTNIINSKEEIKNFFYDKLEKIYTEWKK